MNIQKTKAKARKMINTGEGGIRVQPGSHRKPRKTAKEASRGKRAGDAQAERAGSARQRHQDEPPCEVRAERQSRDARPEHTGSERHRSRASYARRRTVDCAEPALRTGQAQEDGQKAGGRLHRSRSSDDERRHVAPAYRQWRLALGYKRPLAHQERGECRTKDEP